jgi:hypothetical protein
MKSSFLALPLFATAALVCSCEKAQMKAETLGDATFARTTFESLARGDQSVSESIDWNTFNSLGENVGMAYTKIASPEDQRRFREAFITQFASSFQAAGGRVEDFTDWKVVEHSATHTVVSAVSPAKILNVTVNERDGKERISGLSVTVPVTVTQ